MDGPGVGAIGLELVLIAADANLRESLPNLHLQDRCTSLTRSRAAPTVPGGDRRQVSLASITAVVAAFRRQRHHPVGVVRRASNENSLTAIKDSRGAAVEEGSSGIPPGQRSTNDDQCDGIVTAAPP